MLHIDSFSCLPLETNAFLLACLKMQKGVLIDPGQGSGDHFLPLAKEKGISIEAILLTHSHWDHILDLASIQRKLKCPVYVHEADAGNVRNPGSDGIPLPFPCEGVEEISFLIDGKIIKVGEETLEVLHTPGHSPGGVCFYSAKRGVLISGDTLFRGGIGNLSLPTAHPQEMRKSLKRLLSLPQETKVYPGHGEATTIGEETYFKEML